MLALVAVGWNLPAQAVFTFTGFGNPRRITVRVGSANNTVNTVTFNVNTSAQFLNPTPVSGTPGNGAPGVTPANGIEVRVETRIPTNLGWTQVILSVDSSAGLACVGGSGCGTTIVPFNTVAWTSYNHDATYPTFDIQDGSFNGAATQEITNFHVQGGSITMSNVLVFRYNNATFYPAGQYRGRVTYTATMP